MFWAGFLMAIAGYIGWAVLISEFGLDPLGLASALVGSFGLVGTLLAVATFRKTEFAQFVTDAGVPAFAIARTRGSGADSDEFVESMLRQILANKGLT